jgi:hypothetical protein
MQNYFISGMAPESDYSEVTLTEKSTKYVEREPVSDDSIYVDGINMIQSPTALISFQKNSHRSEDRTEFQSLFNTGAFVNVLSHKIAAMCRAKLTPYKMSLTNTSRRLTSRAHAPCSSGCHRTPRL